MEDASFSYCRSTWPDRVDGDKHALLACSPEPWWTGVITALVRDGATEKHSIG
jgi:hypothetical protein